MHPSFLYTFVVEKYYLTAFKEVKNMNDFKDELKRLTYEPAKQLVDALEKNYDKLTLEQKMDLEKLKFGLKIWDLEEQQKQEQKTKGGFRWA